MGSTTSPFPLHMGAWIAHLHSIQWCPPFHSSSCVHAFMWILPCPVGRVPATLAPARPMVKLGNRRCHFLLQAAHTMLAAILIILTLLMTKQMLTQTYIYRYWVNEDWMINCYIQANSAYIGRTAVLLGLDAIWNMFDSPAEECGWYHLPAKTYTSELWIDAHKLRHHPDSESALDWSQPLYPNSELWRAWYEVLHSSIKRHQGVLDYKCEALTRYYCRKYPAIKRLYIVYTMEKYNFTTFSSTRRNITLWGKSCKHRELKHGRRPGVKTTVADATVSKGHSF